MSGMIVAFEKVDDRGAFKGANMDAGVILLVVAILIFLGTLPTWPHSKKWGFWPSGGAGIVAMTILILLLTRKL